MDYIRANLLTSSGLATVAEQETNLTLSFPRAEQILLNLLMTKATWDPKSPLYTCNSVMLQFSIISDGGVIGGARTVDDYKLQVFQKRPPMLLVWQNI